MASHNFSYVLKHSIGFLSSPGKTLTPVEMAAAQGTMGHTSELPALPGYAPTRNNAVTLVGFSSMTAHVPRKCLDLYGTYTA